ncbi:hypothetical protein [Endozoicomonas atrinae]|uniref:hypothetical protein n=1 Tax=Endozoicomonas atrinae TaxID=1333660 RepID=UPI000824C5BA|nr:hypothetical protein [Endozoicomonas atrinae]
MKSNSLTTKNTPQTVYQGDPSRIRGGRQVPAFERFVQCMNPMNWFRHRAGINRYDDYQKASNNLVKSLNDYHGIKLAATNILYLATTDAPWGDIDHKIKEEFNSMKTAIYRRLELTGNDSTSLTSDTDNGSNPDIKPNQETTMSDQDLEIMLDHNIPILNEFEKLIEIIKRNQSACPRPSVYQTQASTEKLEDEIKTAINELTSTCEQSRKKNKQNVNSQLAAKEKIIIDAILQQKPDLATIDNIIHKKIKKLEIPEQYRQLTRLNISWNILLHILGQDKEPSVLRFTELEKTKDLVFHSLNPSSTRKGKDDGISLFFTRFMNQEDKDINSPNRAVRVKEIMTLERSISSGKLQPIPLDGDEFAESVEKSEIDCSGSTTLQSNEIYNFKRAILYSAYGCHKAQLEGEAQAQKDCFDALTMSCMAYFFYMMRAELSEGFCSHADAAIRIIEFILSIKSDRSSLLSKQKDRPFQSIKQLNKHFSECYHQYCTDPQLSLNTLFE